MTNLHNIYFTVRQIHILYNLSNYFKRSAKLDVIFECISKYFLESAHTLWIINCSYF